MLSNVSLSRILRTLSIVIAVLISVPMSGGGKEFTVILDPGHGGHDYGAVGDITNEKSINLAVAKKLGKKINDAYKDVDVVFTRSTDVFISLNERAKIANRAKGDLFISIHVNSVDKKSKNRKTVAGSEVYTLGLHKSEENLAVAKRENSVMALEADFSETYKGFDPNSVESYIIFELSQSRHLDQSIAFAGAVEDELVKTANRNRKGVKQAGFWVLWATGMPAVLVELDFICNPNSERFMASEAGQEKLATALFNAFKQYRDGIPSGAARHQDDSESQAEARDNVQSASAQPSSHQNDGAIDYRIQILAHDTPIPAEATDFKGERDVESYEDGGLVKYTIGHFPSFEAARANLGRLRSKFPEAFIVKMQNGKRVK